MRTRWIGKAVALGTAFFVAACGDDGEGGGPPATPTRLPAATRTATPLAGRIAIVEPAAGARITTYEFPVRVEVSSFTPTSVTMTINGQIVELEGTGGVFTATIRPGPPLRDENVIAVNATDAGGNEITATRSFEYAPPKARARRITDPADLVTGPLAHGRIGDYFLGNDVARFVIQDVRQRDLWSVGTYGGNLIDAELVARPGTDNFLEIAASPNVETVINAQTVAILNDGADGTAAVIRTCGPDDTLDFVNPSTIIESAGLRFPASADDKDYEIDGCTEYRLQPGKPYVEMVTTIFNNEPDELGLYVGDYINASGEVEPWTSTAGGGIGELITGNVGAMSFIGFGQATGVSYAHVTVPFEGASTAGSTFFSTAGVAFVMQGNSVLQTVLGGPPTFVVPAGGSKSYVRYFGVGDGSGALGIDIENEVKGLAHGRLRGCVTIAGRAAAGARVSAGPLGADGRIEQLATQFVTGADGCYRGTLVPGTYGVAAAVKGHPYEGGGTYPVVHSLTVSAGAETVQDIDLPVTGTLTVEVRDEGGILIPARIAVVGFDPSPEPVYVRQSPIGAEATGLFNDISFDGIPYGIVRHAYAGSDGTAVVEVEPGAYQLFVSRGVEYSLFSQPITITAGESTEVLARIARVVDTAGFISSDFHVHGIHSPDSKINHVDRVSQFAGEGVDNIIMTDHQAHTDLKPTIADLGLTPFVHATISEEITTWDSGHFNAYPLTIDPSRPSGGSTDWAGAAPPGRDFVEYGSYGLTPAQVADLAERGPRSTPDTVIQINHISTFFEPLAIDTSVTPPRSFLSRHDMVRFRLDPAVENLYHPFAALELWNGADTASQNGFLRNNIGIWFNHLNQGLITTCIADTDTHQFVNLNAAGARTWTAAASDAPAEVDDGQIARSVRSGRAVGGQGPYVQARLLARDGSGGVADFTLNGSTIVASANGAVDLEIHVQAPEWADYDTIEIYANAATTVTSRNGDTPVLFSAIPTKTYTLRPDDCGIVPSVCPVETFTVETVNVAPGVPGAVRRETRLTVPFEGLATDTWFVVLVKGTVGRSRPMFPVMVGDLDPQRNSTLADLVENTVDEPGVRALGYTNALYADVDGTPGFQPPGVRVE